MLSSSQCHAIRMHLVLMIDIPNSFDVLGTFLCQQRHVGDLLKLSWGRERETQIPSGMGSRSHFHGTLGQSEGISEHSLID